MCIFRLKILKQSPIYKDATAPSKTIIKRVTFKFLILSIGNIRFTKSKKRIIGHMDTQVSPETKVSI